MSGDRNSFANNLEAEVRKMGQPTADPKTLDGIVSYIIDLDLI